MTDITAQWQYVASSQYVSLGCRLVLDTAPPTAFPTTYTVTIPAAPAITPPDDTYPFGRGRDETASPPRIVFTGGQSATLPGPLTVADGIAAYAGKTVEVVVDGRVGAMTATIALPLKLPALHYRDPADGKFKPLTEVRARGFVDAPAGADLSTAKVVWGTTGIPGVTFGSPVFRSAADLNAVSTAIPPTVVDTPGATVTEPTPGTARFHIPAQTLTGPNACGLYIPITGAHVPLDDRLYKVVMDVVAYTKTNIAGWSAGLASVALAVGNDKESPPIQPAQINTLIDQGILYAVKDLYWMNALGGADYITPQPGVFNPPTKVITEGLIEIRNIRIVRQEVVAGP